MNIFAYSVIALILGSITGMGLLNISDPMERVKFLDFSFFMVAFIVVSGYLLGKVRIKREVK